MHGVLFTKRAQRHAPAPNLCRWHRHLQQGVVRSFVLVEIGQPQSKDHHNIIMTIIHPTIHKNLYHISDFIIIILMYHIITVHGYSVIQLIIINHDRHHLCLRKKQTNPEAAGPETMPQMTQMSASKGWTMLPCPKSESL